MTQRIWLAVLTLLVATILCWNMTPGANAESEEEGATFGADEDGAGITYEENTERPSTQAEDPPYGGRQGPRERGNPDAAGSYPDVSQEQRGNDYAGGDGGPGRSEPPPPPEWDPNARTAVPGIGSCDEAVEQGLDGGCVPVAQDPDPPAAAPDQLDEPAAPVPAPAPEPDVDPTVVALSLIAEIEFAGGTPQIGPPAEINPWDIYVVGYPYWFWTDGPTTLTDSQESQGIEVALEATATSVTIDTGDGHTITCNPSTASTWTRGTTPEQESPTCGHTWEQRSATPDHPEATHTVTATTTWQVDWTAGDAAGTETVQRSESVDVVVGELQALITD